MADALGTCINLLGLGCGVDGTPTFGTHTFSSTGIKLAFVFTPENTAAITTLGFRYGVRGGTPATLKIGLQGVGTTTGAPDGTYVGGGSPASATFTPPADATWDGTWRNITLDNSYTPSLDEYLALIIEHSSGTLDGSNFSTITYEITNLTNDASWGFPYAITYNGSAWTKRTSLPIFGARTASTRYGNLYGLESIYTTEVTTDGHRSACYFTLPSSIYGTGTTFQIRKVHFQGKLANATGKNPILGIWDGSTLKQSLTLDTEINSVPTTHRQGHMYVCRDSPLPDLAVDTKYRVGLEIGSGGAGNCYVMGLQLDDAGDRVAYPLSTNVGLSTWNGSAWTDVDTVRPAVQLYLEDLTIAAGSGGMLRHPGMVGGIVG